MMVVDARNVLCPLPVIRTQDAVNKLVRGDSLQVLCTDPGATLDIPTWCRINGHRVHDIQEHGGQRFVTHTGGQREFISFFYVHPASGTGAIGAFNTGTARPAMGKLRTACMKQLSLRMAKKAE